MLIEIKRDDDHYFIDENGFKQGECKFRSTQLTHHCFYRNDKRHGEYMSRYFSGHVCWHCFYINGQEVPFKELPYPETEEDRLYFTLKYDIPLLPAEVKF